MPLQPVEWVLIIHYGRSAHRATYGRLDGEDGSNLYTKDYIQLSRRPDFLEVLHKLFPATASGGRADIVYRWGNTSAPGAFNFSSDRWHMKWETRHGAPSAWKMVLNPSDLTAETIPGDPSHDKSVDAEAEFDLLADRGAGQPYLVAVKLRDEKDTLHLRAYLAGPEDQFTYADLNRAPQLVQDLASVLSDQKHTSWSQVIDSGGVAPTPEVNDALALILNSANPHKIIEELDAATGRALSHFLQNPGHGLFFDPVRNHDAWAEPIPLAGNLPITPAELATLVDTLFPILPDGDAAAELLEIDPIAVTEFRKQIEDQNYGVPDALATVKTRGSAQRAFAERVKANYGNRCAITGISTRDFLVAAHIVPWSTDQTLRLDPRNGICLSLIVDRAFERGYLVIEDDLSIRVNINRIGGDDALLSCLAPYDGRVLALPAQEAPNPTFLTRRRALVAPITS